MPRHYSDGGRVARGAAGRMPGGPPLPNTRSLKERVGALRNLWPFLAMVWRTSPPLTAASLLLRLLRALLPIVTLYIGKLIIDDVVLLVQAPPDRPETLRQWPGQRPAEPAGLIALRRICAGRPGGHSRTRGLARRQPALGTRVQRVKCPLDGARGDARPGGFRGRRIPGSTRAGRRRHEGGAGADPGEDAAADQPD